MKALLLNMPVKFNSWQNLEMPLGIAYIASVLESEGHTVRIMDYEVEPFEEGQFKAMLLEFCPDIAGISFRSSSYLSAKTVCAAIKEASPRVKIVLGGHHATAFPQATLADMNADFVVRGEGEFVTAGLLKAIEEGSVLEGIRGLTFRSKTGVVDNQPSDEIEDLDDLPFPAWHLLKMDRYVTGSILTSRGCPFSCIYCDKAVSTRKVRFRSSANIHREIASFEEKYGKGRIYFIDDYFLLNKKRLLEFFKLLIEDKNLNFQWYCQARVDGIDGQILAEAKKSGCHMIIYGIETGDPAELEYINKKATLDEAKRAITLTRQAGIKSRANFMIGFPISTRKTVSNSIRFAGELNADLYRFFIVSPLPNTVLWERIEKLHPEISAIGWDKFDFYSPSFDTCEIKKDNLVRYVMAAYIYVLKGKVIKELTLEFIPRFLKLAYLLLRNKRLRGNLSVTFPACVNFFLEEWFIIRHIERGKRMKYIRDSIALARKIKDAAEG